MVSPLPIEIAVDGNCYVLVSLLGYGVNGMTFFAYSKANGPNKEAKARMQKLQDEKVVVKITYPDATPSLPVKKEVRNLLIERFGNKCYPHLLCFYHHAIIQPGTDIFWTLYQLLTALKRRGESSCSCNSKKNSNESSFSPQVAMELFVTPYYQGSDLETLLQAGTQLDENTLLLLASQMLDALQILHSAGIVHRDVKPGNILMKSAKEFILIDFDLSTSIGRSSITAHSVSNYLPIELIESETAPDFDLLSQADLFALGITLYELYTLDDHSNIQQPFSRDEDGRYDPRQYRELEEVSLTPAIINMILREYKYRTAGQMRTIIKSYTPTDY